MDSVITKSKSRINHSLREIGLPQQMFTEDNSEEQLFMRMYDITHFAKSPDANVRALFLQREFDAINVGTLLWPEYRDIVGPLPRVHLEK